MTGASHSLTKRRVLRCVPQEEHTRMDVVCCYQVQQAVTSIRGPETRRMWWKTCSISGSWWVLGTGSRAASTICWTEAPWRKSRWMSQSMLAASTGLTPPPCATSDFSTSQAPVSAPQESCCSRSDAVLLKWLSSEMSTLMRTAFLIFALLGKKWPRCRPQMT